MKKVIVSGANGFVGGAVVEELLANGISVVALVHDPKTCRFKETEQLKIYEFSLENAWDVKDILKEEQAEVFYHFAWMGSAGPARADTALQLQNAQWTVDCLRMAKEAGCTRFVCAGSIMEKETMEAAFKQENKPGLGYIYGSGKLVAHTMCKSVAADIGIELEWAMITNAYGIGERSPRMLNTTVQKCIRGENPQFTAGTQNYDFVYIDDVARAFRLIGEKGKPFCEYLIGSSTARPLKEFLLEMKDAIAPELDFIFGDIPYTGVNQPLEDFDCSKLEADTGFKAEVGFAEGCKKTRDWWVEVLREEKE